MIRDTGFVISAYGCWRPGVYESAHAARVAQRRSDEELYQLQTQANDRMPGGVGGTITKQDLIESKTKKPAYAGFFVLCS